MLCGARLQAGMRVALNCPPEGGRYTFLRTNESHTDIEAPSPEVLWLLQ
jgi:hypothetical protein